MAVAGRWAAAALIAVSLSACGATYGSDNFWNDAAYWEEGQASEAALAALSKSDFPRAEKLGTEAMRRNPKDPYAILALALVYENTARPQLARQYFEVLVSMNPQVTALVGTSGGPRTIADIAAQHAGGRPQSGNPSALGSGQVTSAAPGVAPPPQISQADLGGSDDANIIVRFQTLRQLLDDGLLTRDEYNQRRGANLGALLPYTAPPPAAELGRPAPSPAQVAQRLRFLAAAYQEKSITAREQMAERSAILDALLPAIPTVKADAPPPLTQPLQAAEQAGRLEKLTAANVITAAEQAREKAAVYHAVQTYAAASEAAARVASGLAPPPPAAPTGAGVQLAAYHSEMQARNAWAALQKAHPGELGELRPVITKISLRRHRIAWRLNAGPLPDRAAAQALCRRLKPRGQSCLPTTLGN